ncbi:hypothetical protein [Cetobacterium sp.]|uniref:lysine 5,6-aminomutase reactivase subunit KamB n=1 Tax=Cetobacterium sp. TaxID=2071632 RepID=UPI003F381F77
MPFIERLKKYKSVATIGLEKNVGKTETLNYILKRLECEKIDVAVTSIGIDGEDTDIVTRTSKPSIKIYEGMIFLTSEKHYKTKNFKAEILNVSQKSTALGRVVTARALGEGKVLLSGPPSSVWIKELIDELIVEGVDSILVDGALSRMSVGSPIITEAIVLSTGAALSSNLKEVVKKTKHTINLLTIPEIDIDRKKTFTELEDGVYRVILKDNFIKKLEIKSILNFSDSNENFQDEESILYTTGILTDRFVENFTKQRFVENVLIVVKDFTKIFVTPETLVRFFRKGGKLKVLYSTELLAVTINPVSPNGCILDSDELIREIQNFTDVPVLNTREV